MLGIIVITLICLAFYAAIAFGHEDAIKVGLALVWGLLILSIPVSLIYAILR